MGFLSDSLDYDKVAAAVMTDAETKARVERDAGCSIYAPRIAPPANPTARTRNIFGPVLEGIAAAGWRLVEWTVDGGDAYPVFVRAER